METSILETVNTQEFTIKIAEQSDVIEAIYITKVVMSELLKNNYIHPDLFINSYESFKKYADLKALYLLKKDNISLGILTLEEKEPIEFKNISWSSTETTCLYISRIYVLPGWRNLGLGSALIRFAEELAKEKGFNCIRLDTSSSFEEGNLLLMKHKYRFTGNIFYDYQKIPGNCYEKTL